MTVNEYKDIETSLDDVSTAAKYGYLEEQIDRLQWAIEQIDNLKPDPTCNMEMSLVRTRSTYVQALHKLQAQQ